MWILVILELEEVGAATGTAAGAAGWLDILIVADDKSFLDRKR